MLFFIDFKNIFTLIPLNISIIEPEEDLNIDESEEFNIDVQIYLISEGEYKEFIVMDINLSIIRNDNEKHPYKKDDPYFEPNNVRYHSIIQINCIYNYYIFYLGSKAINNFFSKAIFKPIKKAYRKEETRHWIFTIRTMIYRTFIPLSKHPPIYIKKRSHIGKMPKAFLFGTLS